MKNVLRLATVLAAGLALSGCGSFLSGGARVARTADTPQAATPANHLEAGRRYMDQGLTSLAIAEFRKAQQGAETLAEASNGLGVAYARLGRNDLAERYFRMAAAVAPEDNRFAANLVRLYRTTSSTMLARAPEAAMRMPLPEPVPANPGQASVAAGSDRIERISRGEVRIRTVAEPVAAPRAAVVALRLPRVIAAPRAADKASGSAATTPALRTYPQRVILVP